MDGNVPGEIPGLWFVGFGHELAGTLTVWPWLPVTVSVPPYVDPSRPPVSVIVASNNPVGSTELTGSFATYA